MRAILAKIVKKWTYAQGTNTAPVRQRQAGLLPALAARHTLIVFNMEDYGVRRYNVYHVDIVSLSSLLY